MSTYIPCTLVEVNGESVKPTPLPTKRGLQQILRDVPLAEVKFRSDSAFHKDGSVMNMASFVEEFGSVVLEVRSRGGNFAMIAVDKHPSGAVGFTIR